MKRLLLLAARVVSAPAIAHDVQDDEPIFQIGAEVSGGVGGVRPRICMRHRVLRNGKIAGCRRSGYDVWEAQSENGAARSVDVLHD